MSLTNEDKSFIKDELGRSHGSLHSDMMRELIGINKHLEQLNSKVAKHEEAFMNLHLDNKDRDHNYRIIADKVEINTKRLEGSTLERKKWLDWIVTGTVVALIYTGLEVVMRIGIVNFAHVSL